ncbi:MAG: pyrimidine/purine nucleoside phosphorylase [Gammaproteobacteria bacterium]|nr:pyrimidine/purine nucleoside phosphorylase [Gammaproteobacteria bacterium]
MSEFKNVTVVKAASVYFDGRVTSRKVIFADGSYKTLGIMLPGEYEFNTDAKENMEILSGEMDILIHGDSEWQNITGGQSFDVPAKSSFKLKVVKVADYCCSYYP